MFRERYIWSNLWRVYIVLRLGGGVFFYIYFLWVVNGLGLMYVRVIGIYVWYGGDREMSFWIVVYIMIILFVVGIFMSRSLFLVRSLMYGLDVGGGGG